jgi:hypothetical protein
MAILGLIILVIGWLLAIPILITIGLIVLVIGLILLALSFTGGGGGTRFYNRRYY